MPNKLVLIKKRPDFLHVTRNGFKAVRSGFVLQAAKTRRVFNPPVFRIGYTATKKIGNAVCRNRAKRVIREAYRELAPEINGCYDIVFVARRKTVFKKSTEIKEIMQSQFKQLGIM